MPLILPNTLANLIPADGDKLQQNFATIADYTNQELVNRQGSVAMTGPLLLPGAPTQPNQAATKAYVDSTGLVGEIKMYGGDTEPDNWMFCKGQAISRATYAALFAAFGVKFGAGDNSTTFNLPDFRGRSPMGWNEGGTYAQTGIGQKFGWTDAIIPQHAHPVNIWSAADDADHAHTVNLNTGYESNQHWHGPGAGSSGFWVTNGGGVYAAGNSSPIRFVTPSGTDWNSDNHIHNVSGWTSGRSANHKHAINGNTDNAGGGVPVTNRNLGPGLVVNFIVKVQ